MTEQLNANTWWLLGDALEVSLPPEPSLDPLNPPTIRAEGPLFTNTDKMVAVDGSGFPGFTLSIGEIIITPTYTYNPDSAPISNTLTGMPSSGFIGVFLEDDFDSDGNANYFYYHQFIETDGVLRFINTAQTAGTFTYPVKKYNAPTGVPKRFMIDYNFGSSLNAQNVHILFNNVLGQPIFNPTAPPTIPIASQYLSTIFSQAKLLKPNKSVFFDANLLLLPNLATDPLELKSLSFFPGTLTIYTTNDSYLPISGRVSIQLPGNTKLTWIYDFESVPSFTRVKQIKFGEGGDRPIALAPAFVFQDPESVFVNPNNIACVYEVIEGDVPNNEMAIQFQYSHGSRTKIPNTLPNDVNTWRTIVPDPIPLPYKPGGAGRRSTPTIEMLNLVKSPSAIGNYAFNLSMDSITIYNGGQTLPTIGFVWIQLEQNQISNLPVFFFKYFFTPDDASRPDNKIVFYNLSYTPLIYYPAVFVPKLGVYYNFGTATRYDNMSVSINVLAGRSLANVIV